MYYLEKYQSLCDHTEQSVFDELPDLCVPHQAFTPRQILTQFVMNDVQVQTHHPTDNISVNDLSEVMDDEDFDTIHSHLQEFEDEFEAREAARGRLAYKRPRKSKKKVQETEDKKTPPKEEE